MASDDTCTLNRTFHTQEDVVRVVAVTVFRSRSRWHGWVCGLLVLRVALERAILSLRRAIYLVQPARHVTLRCSRTRSSGMLRRFPVFSDATGVPRSHSRRLGG